MLFLRSSGATERAQWSQGQQLNYAHLDNTEMAILDSRLEQANSRTMDSHQPTRKLLFEIEQSSQIRFGSDPSTIFYGFLFWKTVGVQNLSLP